VVDVGGNIGTVTLTEASCVGQRGSVYAFEPQPRIFLYLEKNVAINGFRNVRAFNLALGNFEGNAPFSNARTDDQNAVVSNGQGMGVPVRQLDAMGINEPVVHLLKVDTEGYEKFVFLGASELLRKTSAIYFESWDQAFARYGYHPREVFRLLEGAGFSIYTLSRGALRLIAKDRTSSQVENLLALREPRDFLERTSLQIVG
jgi:FkbM family methyltransferase